MTTGDKGKTTLVGVILEEEVVMTLEEVCRASRLSSVRVIELAREGIVEPVGSKPESWRFRGTDLQRIRCARRLEEDLGVNTPGIALALDLLDELERLRARLGRFEP
jgi:chaperone modulatory protein CbpM